MVGIGPKHISLRNVLERAWRKPFSIQSDFARFYPRIVAAAASEGYITTRIATGLYGNEWCITAYGLKHLLMIRGE